MANYVYISNTGDAALNLAADGWLLEHVGAGDVILYFYVNARAVIIGRHQNAWRECRLSALERDGVQLVRRHSGGGAVYHDGGNLNFSFITDEKNYDLDRQMRVILNAVRALGLEPELSGRNDALIGGKKFSGNAYSLAKGNRSHHGTLLVNADLSALPEYLNVSQAKIRAKGISSVRSRVCNLAEFSPDLTVERMRELVLDSFRDEYGEYGRLRLDGEAQAQVEAEAEKKRSWEWTFGKTPEFDYTIEHRFAFGELQLHFKLREGTVREVKAYSDSLNTSLVTALEAALPGCRFTAEALADAVSTADGACGLNMAEKEEIIAYLMTNGPENAPGQQEAQPQSAETITNKNT